MPKNEKEVIIIPWMHILSEEHAKARQFVESISNGGVLAIEQTPERAQSKQFRSDLENTLARFSVFNNSRGYLEGLRIAALIQIFDLARLIANTYKCHLFYILLSHGELEGFSFKNDIATSLRDLVGLQKKRFFLKDGPWDKIMLAGADLFDPNKDQIVSIEEVTSLHHNDGSIFNYSYSDVNPNTFNSVLNHKRSANSLKELLLGTKDNEHGYNTFFAPKEEKGLLAMDTYLQRIYERQSSLKKYRRKWLSGD